MMTCLMFHRSHLLGGGGEAIGYRTKRALGIKSLEIFLRSALGKLKNVKIIYEVSSNVGRENIGFLVL